MGIISILSLTWAAIKLVWDIVLFIQKLRAKKGLPVGIGSRLKEAIKHARETRDTKQLELLRQELKEACDGNECAVDPQPPEAA